MVRASADCVSVFQDSRTGLGMGDVLPPKRQAVVDRLRKRFELYRRHQNACLPRYEQSVNALYEKQRQDTLLLKQRYLESKAKKAKSKGDHHRTSSAAVRESTPDSQKLIPHNKPAKRAPDGSPAIAAPDHTNEEGERSTKPKSSEKPFQDPAACEKQQQIHSQQQQQQQQPQPQQQQQQQTPTTLNFSVQVVQQFTNCTSAQSHPQTVQTNVTVNSFEGNVTGSTDHSGGQSLEVPASQSLATTTSSATSVVVPTNSCPPEDAVSANHECKQEDERQSDMCQFKNQNTNSSTGSGDRFSDTFPSIAFAEDSGEDVIHPDILKDLIDDVLTNPTDIMKDFNFDDSVGSLKGNDGEKDEIGDLVKDIKDTAAVSELQNFESENLMFNQSIHQHHQISLFDGCSSAPTTVASTMPAMTATSTPSLQPYGSHQRVLQSFGGRSLTTGPSGLGMDFKLSEPSPAALTLKQMAEQHQNMQKQQLGQGIGPTTGARSQFDLDSFTSPVPGFRNRFIGGSTATQKPQSNIFGSLSFDSAPGYPGVTPVTSVAADIFKQSRCNMGNSNRQLSDADKQQQQQLLQISMNCVGEKKPPMYNSNRVNFYPENSNPGNPSLHCTANSRYANALGPDGRQQMGDRLTMGHSSSRQIHHQQQIQTGGQSLKPLESIHHQYPTVYAYSQQPPQQGNNMFQMLLQQNSFSAHFQSPTGTSRPPDYKQRQHGVCNDNRLPVDQNSAYSRQFTSSQHFPSSVNQWRNVHVHHHHQQQSQQEQGMNASDVFQQQSSYSSINVPSDVSAGMVHGIMHHPYKTGGSQMSSGRGPRPSLMSPNSASMVPQQQHQPVNVQGRPSAHGLGSVDGQALVPEVASPLTPTTPVFTPHQDITSGQDSSQINLDFLDNIDSTTSDLLNFDQVMQNTGSHFPLLDDMEMLSK